jgi:hypothetical protein
VTQRWRQLALPFIDCDKSEDTAAEEEGPDGSSLAARLSDLLGLSIQVVFTENRRTLFSFRQRRRGGVLRIHRIFAGADDEVLEAVALFLNDKRDQARPVLHAFADAHRDVLHPKRPAAVRQKGRIFHLGEIFRSLNERFFRGDLRVGVGWGRRGRRPKRAVRLGSYDADSRLIRVNPVLDHPSVPQFVVEEVLFHEMVHAEIGIESSGGRRSVHGPGFRRRERAFPHRRAAQQWLYQHLPNLLVP